ncbi:hypothetical protein HCN44_008668 [Aphidius gifuensis]|uniref:DNA-directed RNA polymerase RpoA/D/Rpb3-type domain-containing protein n=1 Tax=Aphidius gifuensis TaxID=684658 RepID=A0A834XRL4_APHGI|nr:hypothetical protein HCN44_008668 [Aphidius gifuensis]
MSFKQPIPRVILGEYGIPNANEYSNLRSPGPWNIEKYKENIKISVVKKTEEDGICKEIEFDIVGCSHALANAYRRIMLSEIPSMAIEKVFILNNTTNPMFFDDPSPSTNDNDEVSEQDTLRYELKIKCTKNPEAPKDSQEPKAIYCNSHVYSSDIQWVPLGGQKNMYPNGENDFGMLEKDILICKMRPGQEICAYMHAVKGVGKDHAKFSPVATATYRLLPDIQLKKKITGELAEKLQSYFSPGVIELVKTKDGVEAKVKDARYDSCSRNVYGNDELKNSVDLGRISNHFIFNVETVGAIPPNVIFLESVKVLKKKCRVFLEELDNIS